MSLKITSRPWISLYVYYHEDPTPLLVKCLHPLAEELHQSKQIQAYFYVRYWEGGPHVRFRVLPHPEINRDQLSSTIRHRIEQYLLEHPSEVVIDPERYAKASAYFSQFELGQVKPFELRPNNSVLEVTYVPEFQSYGGERAIPIVEEQFFASSQIGLQLLEQEISADRRIGRAMLMMLSGLHAFTPRPDELQHWFTVYNRNWMPALQPNPEAFAEIFRKRFERQREHLKLFVHQVLQVTPRTDDVMQHWRNSQQRLYKQLHQLAEEQLLEYNLRPLPIRDLPIIALNTLHMHNNRIGISLHEEAYLTFLLKEALAALALETNWPMAADD
jgi:thiopeptide-type bacteriocin biosynthesis protein